MTFWILAAILAFIATLCVVMPLARNKNELVPDIQLDKALYHARINEIDQDLKLGGISSQQAEAAKSEEGRKLISAAKFEKADKTQSSFVRSVNFYRVIQGVSIITIPIISLSVYMFLGSPSIPDQSLASRISADPVGQTLEENVARVEAHLAKSPNDASGWAVLAPVYTRMNRFGDAANAWSRVLQLNPKFPQVRSMLAESIMNTTGGIVTKKARDLFIAELKIDPSSAKSRYYIALSLSQEGRFNEAYKSWQLLIEGSNPQAPWLETARKYRDEAMKSAGISPSLKQELPKSEALNGPSKDQVLEAQKLSKNERTSMIQSMVDGLAEKLKDDPSDQQGWLRLIRAYSVLKDHKSAMSAINKAKTAHVSDISFIASLNDIQQTIEKQGNK